MRLEVQMILIHPKELDPQKVRYQMDKFCAALLGVAEDLIESGEAERVRESLKAKAQSKGDNHDQETRLSG